MQGRWPLFLALVSLGISLGLAGCGAALFGAGAAGGYALSRSERTPSEILEDAAITSKVKAKLIASTKVRGLNVDVDTYQAVVTLNGVARSQEEIDWAITLAENVQGVKEVVSNLQLRETEKVR